jgi:transcriptional regulator with XRE-family HTH domain
MPSTLRRYPNNLYALRRSRGYRQKTVARLLGQKGTYMVSCYERGLTLPPLPVLIKLTIILGAQLPELYPQLRTQLEREVWAAAETLPRGTRRPSVGRQKGNLS